MQKKRKNNKQIQEGWYQGIWRLKKQGRILKLLFAKRAQNPSKIINFYASQKYSNIYRPRKIGHTKKPLKLSKIKKNYLKSNQKLYNNLLFLNTPI
jgi:hypothetical protein